MDWPERPSPKWTSIESETELQCHACKEWKPAWHFINPKDGTTGSIYTIREFAKAHKRWACSQCFLNMGLKTGLYLINA
jgi:hypothetical protein